MDKVGGARGPVSKWMSQASLQWVLHALLLSSPGWTFQTTDQEFLLIGSTDTQS